MLLVLLQLCFLCGRFGCVCGGGGVRYHGLGMLGHYQVLGANILGLKYGCFLFNHFDGSQWLEIQCLSAHHAVILDSSGIHLRSL